jgi:hypothetical protein
VHTARGNRAAQSDGGGPIAVGGWEQRVDSEFAGEDMEWTAREEQRGAVARCLEGIQHSSCLNGTSICFFFYLFLSTIPSLAIPPNFSLSAIYAISTPM